jgi:hypothetical protein
LTFPFPNTAWIEIRIARIVARANIVVGCRMI